MLAEQRYEAILGLIEENGSVTINEIIDLLGVSESTARRDITSLHNQGRLTRVFGGAVSAGKDETTAYEPTVDQKHTLNNSEKEVIGKKAAALILDNDFVYIDAGTTTEYLIEFIDSHVRATYVTNAVTHAKKIAQKGLKVILIGGELKASTEAIIGTEAIETLLGYHFTKGFFGTNGISKQAGFTTPDIDEAMVKQTAMKQCNEKYVLADSSKFNQVSSVTFGGIKDAIIISEKELQ